MRPYDYVTSADKLAAIAREVEQTDAYALDLETAEPTGGGSVDPFTGRIRIVSLNTGANRYVIDLYRTGTLGPLEEAIKKTNAVCVGQNLKFDQKWLLWHHGIELKRLFDSFRASSILYAGLPGVKHHLWSINKRELGEDPATEDLAASDWNGTLTKAQLDYAADDVDRMLRLREIMRPKLAGADLNKIALIEFQAVLPEAAIELNGLRLDAEMWRKRTQLDAARARALAALLKQELPNPIAQLGLPGIPIDEFNLDSPDQILKSLRSMGIKQKVKDPVTYATSILPLQDTKEMTLAMLADKWPILSKFIEYRGYSKNASAFGDDFLENIHAVTGRIHCQYHPYTDAGRYSCVAPETLVKTSTGLKPIIEVQVGEKVWTHRERWREVKAFLPQGSMQTYRVSFSTGDILTCSANHRLLLSNGQWMAVGQMLFHLERRDIEAYTLSADRERPVTVESVGLADRIEVYDLTVDEDESYETLGVFSHNCRSPNLQQIPRGKDFRECFRVEEDRELAICDWSNIEMRLAAEVSKDKKLIAVFNNDDDAHYVTAMLMTGKQRKEITKNERQQAKPVNFGFCIAEGQRVLTKQAGLVAIEQVQSWHLVWDGVEWVSHEGVLFMGEREVITHDGLTATPDHNVYTDLGKRIPLRDAASSLRHGRLAVGAVDLTPVRYSAFDWEGREAGAQPEVRRGGLHGLSEPAMVTGGQREGWKNHGVRLSAAQEVPRPKGGDVGRTLRRYGAALRAGLSRLFTAVQGAWDSSVVRVAGGLHPLGTGNLSAVGLQEAGVRPGGQQRALLPGKSATDNVLGEPTQQGIRRARTYDLLNAGPRHRFTVEGKVVSNCYGMSAAKLVLYAKSSYGVNLSETEAKKFRKAFFDGYSGIESWHRFALDSGKRIGETRTLWKRRRLIKDPKAHNEFLNSPIQGSGADGLKNSLRVVYEKLKKLNGGGIPLLAKGANAAMVHMVHDEILVEHKKDPELAKSAQEALHSGMIEGMAPMMPSVKTAAEVGGGSDWSVK